MNEVSCAHVSPLCACWNYWQAHSDFRSPSCCASWDYWQAYSDFSSRSSSFSPWLNHSDFLFFQLVRLLGFNLIFILFICSSSLAILCFGKLGLFASSSCSRLRCYFTLLSSFHSHHSPFCASARPAATAAAAALLLYSLIYFSFASLTILCLGKLVFLVSSSCSRCSNCALHLYSLSHSDFSCSSSLTILCPGELVFFASSSCNR